MNISHASWWVNPREWETNLCMGISSTLTRCKLVSCLHLIAIQGVVKMGGFFSGVEEVSEMQSKINQLTNIRKKKPTRVQGRGDFPVLHEEGRSEVKTKEHTNKPPFPRISDVGWGPINIASPKPEGLARIIYSNRSRADQINRNAN